MLLQLLSFTLACENYWRKFFLAHVMHKIQHPSILLCSTMAISTIASFGLTVSICELSEHEQAILVTNCFVIAM